jgi:hypothetical protein
LYRPRPKPIGREWSKEEDGKMATGTEEWEQIQEELRSEGRRDLADRLEPFSATQLRQKAGKADELERELSRTKSELEEIRTLPQKEQAFRDAGVDFASLRPAEAELIRNSKIDGEINAEWAEKLVEKYQLPVGEMAPPPGDSGASQMVDQARSAPMGGGKRGSTITPDQLDEWDMPTRQKFRKEHPDAWQMLGDGKEVTGIVFNP